MTLEQLFAGRGVDIPSVLKRLEKTAAECGLPFGRRTHTYNSRRAQELGKWAESLNKGEEFHMAAFRAYFVDGKNIAELPVLKEIIRSIGLDEKKVEEILAGGVFKEEVDSDWSCSRRNEVMAVPTFMARGRRLVGAQSYEALEKLIGGGAIFPG